MAANNPNPARVIFSSLRPSSIAGEHYTGAACIATALNGACDRHGAAMSV